ncbi:DUF6978 family protein [Hydrogenimonas sp.]
MLEQKELSLIVEKEKRIEESISIGDFSKKTYPIVFIEEEYNHYNLSLDISKSGSIEIKHTVQKRAMVSLPVLRLDINGFHTNPHFDESIIDFEIEDTILTLMQSYSGYRFRRETHLHYYIKNFNERWAFPPESFGLEVSKTFEKDIGHFCEAFNIHAKIVKEGLF